MIPHMACGNAVLYADIIGRILLVAEFPFLTIEFTPQVLRFILEPQRHRYAHVTVTQPNKVPNPFGVLHPTITVFDVRGMRAQVYMSARTPEWKGSSVYPGALYLTG